MKVLVAYLVMKRPNTIFNQWKHINTAYLAIVAVIDPKSVGWRQMGFEIAVEYLHGIGQKVIIREAGNIRNEDNPCIQKEVDSIFILIRAKSTLRED